MRDRAVSIVTHVIKASVILSGTLAVFFLCLLVLVVFGGIAGRVLLGSPIVPNHEELAGYLMVASIFFGLPASFRAGSFVRVSILIDKVSERPRAILSSVLMVAAVVYIAIVTYISADLAMASLAFGSTSFGGSGMPLFIPQATLAIGSALFLLYLIAETTVFLLARSGGEPGRPSSSVEGGL